MSESVTHIFLCVWWRHFSYHWRRYCGWLPLERKESREMDCWRSGSSGSRHSAIPTGVPGPMTWLSRQKEAALDGSLSLDTWIMFYGITLEGNNVSPLWTRFVFLFLKNQESFSVMDNLFCYLESRKDSKNYKLESLNDFWGWVNKTCDCMNILLWWFSCLSCLLHTILCDWWCDNVMVR